MPKAKITVTVLGREYVFEGDFEDAEKPLHWNALAQYVEDKLKTADREFDVVSTIPQHVLAALLTAHELFKLQEKRESGGEGHSTKVDELVKLLDDSLR